MQWVASLAVALGLMAVSLTSAWTGVAHAQNLLNCADFPTQAAAQASLRANPGDPDRLDADHDGIACEHLPGPRDTQAVRYCAGECGFRVLGPPVGYWTAPIRGR